MNYDGIFNKFATNYGVNTFTNPITSGEVKLIFSDDFCNEYGLNCMINYKLFLFILSKLIIFLLL